MTDRREAILVRLLAIGVGIPGVLHAARNQQQLPPDKRPGVLLVDGDESVGLQAPSNRPNGSPVIVEMTPELYFAIKLQGPENLTAGSLLNAFRVEALKRVMTDGALAGLVSSNGSIRYSHAVSDLARGRAMNGEIGLAFIVRYPLILSEL